MLFATKEANYSAGAGETIVGDLARGAGGKFTSGGHSQQVNDHKGQRAALQATHSQSRQSLRDKYKAELAKAPANKKREILQRYSQEARALNDTHRAERRALSSRQSADRTASQGNRHSTIIQIGQERQALQDKHRLEQRQLQDTQRAARSKVTGNDRKTLTENQRGEIKGLQAKHAQERQTLAAKHDQMRNANKETDMFIYKGIDGNPRWLTISSTTFEDRDGEFISRAAHEADELRADKEGDYGPLLWWHEPKLVIGHCDFSAMHNRSLIESGTFISKEIAEGLAPFADLFGVSIGYDHESPTRGKGVTFGWIRKGERSVLPDVVASNELTHFTIVKEGDEMTVEKMKTHKVGILEKFLGKKTVDEILARAETVEKEAEAKGKAFKAAGDTADPNALAMDAATEMPDGMDNEADPNDLVMDMSQSDLRSQIHDAVDEALNALEERAFKPVLDTLAKLSGSATATKEVQDGLFTAIKQVSDTLVTIGKDNADLKATVIALKTRLDTLEGDVPVITTRIPGNGRATSNPNTVLKETALLGDIEDAAIDPWKLASASMTAQAAKG